MRMITIAVLVLMLTCFAGPAFGDDLCPPDEVWVEIDGDTALVHHESALFNCCPIMESEIVVDGWMIDIVENEVEALCWCECCFDLLHEVRDLTPGSYTVRVWGAYGCDEDPCGSAEFTIGAGGGVPSLVSAMSGCGGWALFVDGFESGDTTAWCPEMSGQSRMVPDR